MNNKIKLPSDKKFGLFFSAIFLIVYFYFLYFKSQNLLYLILTSISLALISFIKPSILNKLNFAWYKFGILLSKLFSPLILGLIFFFIITPIAIFMKIINRDHLDLKNKKKDTYWKNYDGNTNMKDQF